MLRRTLFAAAALALCACSGGTTTQTLVILHTNDEHSHLLGDGPEVNDFPAPTTAGSGAIKGGYARRAVFFAKERADAAAANEDVLALSAGDNAMGSLAQLSFTTVAPDYLALSALHYDATTLGNHEFDYSPAGLAASLQVAKASAMGLPPVISSNIHFSGGSGDASLAALYDATGADSTKPLHKTWVLTTKSGIKVGLIGVMGLDAAVKAPLKAPVVFSVGADGQERNTIAAEQALFDELQPLVDSLRRDRKVDLVIALSHGGVDVEHPENGEDQILAENVSGIDVIVSGHTHTNYPATLVTNPKSGRQVLIQQAGRYGDHYGRMVMSVKIGAKAGDPQPVTFDMTRSTVIPIDDKTVPDPTAAAFVSGIYGTMETAKVAALGNRSFLEYTESLTLGTPVSADPANVGALAFHPVVASTYTIHEGAVHTETALTRAAADAILAATEATQGHTDLAVEAYGAVRDDIIPDKAGMYSFADIFQAVPLGASPSGLPGYPLARFGLYLAEIKAAFEVSAGFAYESVSNGDYFLVPAGMCFKYDTSKPEFDNNGSALDPTNGRITEIRVQVDHTLLDTCLTNGTVVYSTSPQVLAASPTGYLVNPLGLYTVSANLYIAEFAAVAGVHLKDATTGIPLASPVDGIEHAQIAPGVFVEIKEWEALGGYLRGLAAIAGGTVPPIYDDTQSSGSGARRALCSGPLCK